MESIEQNEQALRQAMLTSDYATLDKLIADELMFVNHFGMVMKKSDDLDAHKRKAFSLSRLDFRSQEIRQYGDTVVTITTVDMAGDWNGPFTDALVYLRVWRKNTQGEWQVVAGQATRCAEPTA